MPTDVLGPCWLEVDLSALAANLAEVRGRHPGVRFIASVKANAYGHGAVEVARTLSAQGSDMLATGSLADAIAIREAGVESPILLFAGFGPEAVGEVVRRGFIPTVHQMEGARQLSETATDPIEVYVKVDGGLGRVGVPIEDARTFIADVAALPRIEVTGVYTHLPFADREGIAWAADRSRVFADLLAKLADDGIRPRVTQFAASSAVLAGLPDDCSAICPGHVLYGLSTVSDDVGSAGALQTVARALKTRLIQVVAHRDARRAGLGGADALGAGSIIGVLPVGLEHGMMGAGRPSRVAVGQQPASVLGISLEHTTIDLSASPEAAVDDEVTIFDARGPITLADVASSNDAAPLEVLLTYSRRMPVRYLD